MAESNTGWTPKGIMKELDDRESVADIVAQFEFSAEGKHLGDGLKAVAHNLLNELQKRLAVTTDSDEQLAVAREARTAWHKAVSASLR